MTLRRDIDLQAAVVSEELPFANRNESMVQ
jgi:hypothetical protein